MNKKIWLTGALSILVIFATVFIYKNFIMEEPVPVEPPIPVPSEAVQSSASNYISLSDGLKREIEYSNDIFTVIFSTDGGKMTSLRLNNYRDETAGTVEMIFSGDSGLYPFSIHPGNFETPEINGIFDGRLRGDMVIFTGDFSNESGQVFTITKTYSFAPGSYMLQFDLKLESAEGQLPMGDGTHLYSLGFGPQLGPEIEKMNRGYIYRYYCLNDGGVKRNIAVPAEDGYLSLETPYSWLGIEGRYFTYLTIPAFDSYHPAWDERDADGIFKRNSYYLQRLAGEASGLVSDRYYMYFGPKDESILRSFNSPETNAFALSGLQLDLASGRTGIVQRLSQGVKVVLRTLNRVIPNYGIDIILFALLIQVIIFPISKKTYRNSIRMQLLGPEIGRLRKKLKYNQNKMNQEIAKLFEENDVKPRSSMLPFIIHLPFFILLYVLLLTDVDFRLAAFIPGWISDISLPEHIFDFSPAAMPITSWDKIRVLPIIVLAVSLIQSRYVQAPEDSIGSMRVMSYLLPIVMFIVIYNMPAGTVLYWLTMTATNLLLQWRIKTKYAPAK
ncbi:MAG: membrane protein insertase YidC [Spirochaetales bacterium]|nr:membrane protein insertase YidC [Spirochaetales bacterium]